jgi:hypothetical protein
MLTDAEEPSTTAADKDKQKDADKEEYAEAPRFQITDWCYHFRVMLGKSSQDRFAAHRIIAFN